MPASARDLPTAGSIRGRRFTRVARLTEGKQYQQVFARAKRRGDRFFTVLTIPNEAGSARLGMAIARRQLPRAVDRNRIKRVIRESFRQNRAEIGAYDIVVLVRAAAGQANNAELFSALERHWRRLSAT